MFAIVLCSMQDLLASLYKKQYDELPVGMLMQVRKAVACFHKLTKGRITVSTACSGTDLIVYAWEKLAGLWDELFGLRFEVVHSLSCESVRFKQDWIRAHFDVAHIFPDLHRLADSTVEDIEGCFVNIGASMFFACGIECDSVSALNGKRKENADCIQDDSKESRTGSTARSCMRFIEKTRPPLWLAENVKNLQASGEKGESNLAALIKLANKLGYFVLTIMMSPDSCGVPQSRGRFYIIGIMVASSPIEQLRKAFVEPTWVFEFRAVISAMKLMSLPITAFLAADDDPEVVAAQQARGHGAAKKKKKKAKARGKAGVAAAEDVVVAPTVEEELAENYEVDHLAMYKQHSVSWPPQFDANFLAKTERLVQRQKEILWLEEQVHGKADQLKTWFARDLNMSLGWGQTREELFPCIVSTSTMWIRGLLPAHQGQPSQIVDRLVAGSELLSLQGFPLSFQEEAFSQYKGEIEFSDQQKTDLAGNAFNGAVLGPLLSALISAAPIEKALELMSLPFKGDGDDGNREMESAHDDDSPMGFSEQEEAAESEAPVTPSPVRCEEEIDMDDLGLSQE